RLRRPAGDKGPEQEGAPVPPESWRGAVSALTSARHKRCGYHVPDRAGPTTERCVRIRAPFARATHWPPGLHLRVTAATPRPAGLEPPESEKSGSSRSAQSPAGP